MRFYFTLITYFITTKAFKIDTCQPSLVHGYFLDGSVVERIPNIGLNSCAKECLFRAGYCRSFNYDADTFTCEINNNTTSSGPLIKRKGFTYSSINVWSKDLASECKDVQCAKYYKCFIGPRNVHCAASACPAGKYGTGEKCNSCPKGQFKSFSGKQWCEYCPACTYQDDLGSTECKPCTAGTFQNTAGSTTCIDCYPGTYTNKTGQYVCKKCPAGYYQDRSGQTACKFCRAGTSQNEKGATKCTPCSAGTFQSANGLCIDCSPGSYTNKARQVFCLKCAPGTFQNNSGQTTCIACPAGYYSDTGGSSSCTKCNAGSYQNQNGQTSCKSCEGETFQDEEGKTLCKNCSGPDQCVMPGGKGCESFQKHSDGYIGQTGYWAGYFNVNNCINACKQDNNCLGINLKGVNCYKTRSKTAYYYGHGFVFYENPCRG